MAVTVFKTFSAGEILTASDLNSSFSKIVDNGEDLAWPATKAKDLNGQEFILDADADSSITADTDDRIDFKLQGQDLFIMDGTTASAVDGIEFKGVATASPSTVTITAQGTSTNINLDLIAKGSGTVLIGGGSVVIGGQDNQVSRINLLDYGEITNAIGATGGGTQDIDIELGNSVSATVDTSANTFTFSNPTASDELCGWTFILVNGGSQTVNWPASVDWAGGTAPTLTTAGTDVLVFFTIDGGTIWHGALAIADSKSP